MEKRDRRGSNGSGVQGGKRAGQGREQVRRTAPPNRGLSEAAKGERKPSGSAGGNRRPGRPGKKSAPCPAFGKCGGCSMIDIPYPRQMEEKRKRLEELLGDFGAVPPVIGMEKPERYRNKVHAVFTHDRQGKPLSGVYKEGTHYVVPVENCLLEDEKADAIIASIRGLLPSFKIKTYDEDTGYGLLRHVLIRVGKRSGQIMVVLVLSSPILPSKNNFVKALRRLHPEITTVVVNVNDRDTSMVLGDKQQVIYGKGYIEDELCGKRFRISPKSFYQVNPVQTEKLYGLAMEMADLKGKETVLDAYCGIGTISLVAADRAEKVIGVELNPDAVRDAVLNARQNQAKNIVFYQRDAGEFMTDMAAHGEKVDVVFMDPPRAGSDEAFLGSLAKLSPKKIVYISCNPETLARDLKYLVGKGYEVRRMVGVDMFPGTGCVECVASIQRKHM